MPSIYNELIFADALEAVDKLLSSTDSNETADRLEKMAAYPDLALACLMLLYMKAKGVDTTEMTASNLANAKPSLGDLILPSGVSL